MCVARARGCAPAPRARVLARRVARWRVASRAPAPTKRVLDKVRLYRYTYTQYYTVLARARSGSLVTHALPRGRVSERLLLRLHERRADSLGKSCSEVRRRGTLPPLHPPAQADA